MKIIITEIKEVDGGYKIESCDPFNKWYIDTISFEETKERVLNRVSKILELCEENKQ